LKSLWSSKHGQVSIDLQQQWRNWQVWRLCQCRFCVVPASAKDGSDFIIVYVFKSRRTAKNNLPTVQKLQQVMIICIIFEHVVLWPWKFFSKNKFFLSKIYCIKIRFKIEYRYSVSHIITDVKTKLSIGRSKILKFEIVNIFRSSLCKSLE